MELILGKKFKLPIWERALKTMWINEVAKFSVDKEVTIRPKEFLDKLELILITLNKAIV